MAELSAKALELRDRVRDFMCTQVSGAYIERTRNGLGLSKEEQVHWHGLLDGQGWLANHWPQEWGGTGWTALERYVFDCETAVGNAPRILPFGVSMLAPVILKFGTQQQKECWLPRIRSGGDWWCQCYSEPGAGTDLASLKTSAVRDGEHYVVNGQKTWTTFGQYANMMFCLVRTNHQVKAQEGISFLLIDMDTPGIEVRPLYMLNGEHEVNEVFFNDVRVPVANLVGEENKGWDCAKYLLTYERTGIAGVGICISLFNKLRALSEQAQRNGRPLIDDALFRQKLAEVWMDIANLKETNLRILMHAEKGGVPGAESSVLKILGTEIRQELFSLLRQAAGSRAIAIYEAATAGDDACPTALLTATDNYFNHRKLSIFGGSNQTGQMLAALTDLPQATFASRVEVAGDKVSVTREVDGGLEALSLSIPAIITTDLRLNEPRYLTLPNIMKAKKKQLDVFKPEELGVDVTPRIKTLKVSEPAKRGAGVKVADVAALVDRLKNEAKVI